MHLTSQYPYISDVKPIIFQALSLIRDRRSKETKEKMEREKELCKVTILKEHVDIIVSASYPRIQYRRILNLNCDTPIRFRLKKWKYQELWPNVRCENITETSSPP